MRNLTLVLIALLVLTAQNVFASECTRNDVQLAQATAPDVAEEVLTEESPEVLSAPDTVFAIVEE